MISKSDSISTESISIVSIADLIAKQQQIRTLHYHLMAIYVELMEITSRPDRLLNRIGPSHHAKVQPLSGKYWRKSWLDFLRLKTYGPITRILIHLHIKTKLSELKAAYAQIEQVIAEREDAANFGSWISNIQGSLSRFSDTLSVMTIVRRIVAALWPLIIASVVLAPVWDYISRTLSNRFNSIQERYAEGAVLYVAGYVTIMTALAFQQKRKLFLAPIFRSANRIKSSAPDLTDLIAGNLYEAESDLFKCIYKQKRPEFAIDRYAVVGGMIISISYFTDYAIHFAYYSDLAGTVINAVSAFIMLLGGSIYLAIESRRTPV